MTTASLSLILLVSCCVVSASTRSEQCPPIFLLTAPPSARVWPFEIAQPLYVGARAIGMGNAFTAMADDAAAGFWNPAGLIQWQGVKVFGMNKISDRSEYGFDPKGIAYTYRETAFFWGNKIALGVPTRDPDYTYYALARQIGSYLAIGGSLKFQRRHPSDHYQVFGYNPAYDLALLTKPKPALKIGLLLQNDQIDLSFERVTLGLAYRIQRQRLRLTFSLDLGFSRRSINGKRILTPSLGVELPVNELLQLRMGNSSGDWTVGAGLSYPFQFTTVRLDYAWINDTLQRSNFISAEITF
ncbi:MAG: hypothetical protein QF569_00555 [Candidatus Poribacteria bacterium]|nr:hypothetical protein [Candidatus Poribacteria bacterium]